MALFNTPTKAVHTLRALAWLLRYPDPALRQHLPGLHAALHDERALTDRRLAEIDRLIDRLQSLPPLCGGCGGLLKNDTVMFGEPIPEDALRECYQQAATADAFIVVGTSAVVGMTVVDMSRPPTRSIRARA